jgi:TatD DNase family protein
LKSQKAYSRALLKTKRPLNKMWIDSHCHLNHKNIAEKGTPDEIIKAAKFGGVDGMLTICCRIAQEANQLIKIANDNSNVWCSIGTHPHDAGQETEKHFSTKDIVALVQSNPKIIGIGETGLDYYYNYAPKEDQQSSFRKHIRACIAADLPMIVHTRDAEEDTFKIMQEEGAGTNLSGVMHCFSSKQILAEQALEMGFYISFSGMVTFPKADDLRETAKIIPLDRILVETDAPFLAPVPHRGKTNEPAFVARTGEFLANFYGISTEDFAKITTDNFFRLFKKAQLTWVS